MSSDSKESIIIEGGYPLSGSVKISGAKNAALPIMAASLLCSQGSTKLTNLPMVGDVFTLKKLMENLGASVTFSESCAHIEASRLKNFVMPLVHSQKMRASILVAGPLLATVGEVKVVNPGGCVIGERPIDLHFYGFKQLGAKIEYLDDGYVQISGRLKGCTINLPYPSVGATENILMASCLSKGKTVIKNVAKEPEIIDLINFLVEMGAQISGTGSSKLTVTGVDELHPTKHKIVSDRIEAGTFLIAGAITGGKVELIDTTPIDLIELTHALTKIGVKIEVDWENNRMVLNGENKYAPIDVKTEPHPGFPTDLHPLLTSLLSLSKGVSTITENVFPKRFCYVKELKKFGAKIDVENNKAIIHGVKKLSGAKVSAPDLRGGAALVLAGLAAKGVTTVDNVHFINRGYERFDEKLKNLGAHICLHKKVGSYIKSCIQKI